MKMRKFSILAAVIAALLPAVSGDTLGVLVDSTGTAKTVTATLVIPPGLTINQVKDIVGPMIVGGAGDGGAVNAGDVPAGYQEIVTVMGPRDLGAGDAGLASSGFYYALAYPVSVLPISAGAPVGLAAACGQDTTRRVVVSPTQQCSTGDSSSCVADQTQYYVCEPPGTRSTLQKVIGATVATVGPAIIGSYQLPGTLAVNTSATTHICQLRGYSNFVQGSVMSTGYGSGCDDNARITQWNGSAWKSDTICYNQLLTSMQCWK